LTFSPACSGSNRLLPGHRWWHHARQSLIRGVERLEHSVPLNRARSRNRLFIFSRTLIDQMSWGFKGGFCPMIFPCSRAYKHPGYACFQSGLA
jgi:hypothetical protein